MFEWRHLMGMWLCSLVMAGGGVSSPIDQGAATRCFREAKALSDQDGGKLWGVPLYGAMLFVEGDSRVVTANQPDGKAALQGSGDVWEGSLPKVVGVANTAIEWSGISWTMVKWPLPENRHARASLLMHECFHRIQKNLGLEIKNPPCGHLDTKEGRIWLQLEWRALSEALVAHGPDHQRAIQDALLFRAHRRALFPGAAEAERDLELTEGLAEYTGVRLSSRSEAEALAGALVDLDRHARQPTFVRSFAYASGPAYGLLLDRSVPGWRRGLNAQSDLGELLQKASGSGVALAVKDQALVRAARYGSEDLIQDETRRDEAQKGLVARFRAHLVEGPVLILPRTGKFEYRFDPNNLVPLGDVGMVYPTFGASDSWGTLDVSKGALLTASDLRLPVPQNPSIRPLKGEGWSLDLALGWVIVPGPRKGDYHLEAETGKPTASASAAPVK
jgi:hypothetical protein